MADTIGKRRAIGCGTENSREALYGCDSALRQCGGGGSRFINGAQAILEVPLEPISQRAAPIVSAITTPRSPSGFSEPTVESLAV